MRRAVLLLSAVAYAQAQCDGLGLAVCNSMATCIWNAPWKPGVCVDDPCAAAPNNSAACEATEVAVTPCPDPPPDPYYCLFSPCVWNGQCERQPCLHTDQVVCDAEKGCQWMPPASGVPAGPVQAVANVCLQTVCGHLDRNACFAATECTYTNTNWTHGACLAIVREECDGYSNAAACRRDPTCRWNATAAQCQGHPCTKNFVVSQCDRGECTWNKTCIRKTCNQYNPLDKCACTKDPDCTLHQGKYCREIVYSECPDLDVAVLLDGSGSMRSSFGQHPHGFYGMLEILRAWVQTLPLSGDDHLVGATTATKATGGFRVTFIQFAKPNALPSESHPTGCAVGQCTDGLLSGQLAELEGDITWHENNFQGHWSYIHSALQDIADHTFLASHSPAWRQRAVIIITDSSLNDFDGDSCCNYLMGCGTSQCVDTATFDPTFSAKVSAALDTLRAAKVRVYGAVIRRSDGHTPQDEEAATRLKANISVPRDEHFANVMLDDLVDNVLNTLCDPNSTFGTWLADPLAGQGCQGKANETSCEADSTCAWDAAQTPGCYDSPCFPLCDEATCNRDALCLWNTNVCEVKPSCNADLTQATCERAGHLWNPIWSATPRCECDPCKLHTQEPACVGQTVTMPAPCTPPFDKPDYCKLPVCEFDATGNTCSKQKCLNVDPTACVKETDCVWTPVTPTPDQPVVQVGQCAPPVCTTLPHVCAAGFQLKPTASTTTCLGTPSTCNDATCCVADPLCNTYTCTSGSQLKASASSITCTGTPSICTDATCCDKLCSTHTCAAGFQLKPAASTTTCPGIPSTCNDATCCVADPLCNTHTCASGSQLKASASSITCTGTPSACTDATCCDKLCSTHTCDAGFQLKPAASTTTCPGTPSTCNAATCCVADKLCNTHTCAAGFQLKASASSITCTGTPAACTDVLCCEKLCSTHTCSDSFLAKPSKATLPCRGTPPVCDDATCCDAEFVCADHTCGTGFVGNALKGNTSCGARRCPDETCCLAAAVPVSTFVPAEEQTTARLLGGTTSGGIAVVSVIGGATGASGLGKGGARMARSMVYLSMMDCPRSGVEEVGFVLSPTRLSFGGDDLRELRGAVVGNLALLALVVALLVGVAALQGGRFLVSLASMPLALPVFLLEMLWMPVMQGGFAFIMYSESEAAGGAAVLTCAFLFLVGTGLLTRKARAQCTFVRNEREKGLVWFVTAAGSWESTGGPRPIVDVLASVFDGFHPAHCLYFVVQLVMMTGLAALAAWNPKTITYCSMRAGMLTILPIVWAAVLLKDLPYLRPIENVVEIVITLCEFIFGVLAALAVGDQDQSLYDAAAVLGVVMTCIMMVKAAVDICTLVYQLREGYTNHGTVCGPPVRMCCSAGCSKCAFLAASKVSFSEPMLASCTAHELLGTSESETSLVQLQAVPSPAQCYACERDGYVYQL